MKPYAYYIFDDINIREATLRIQTRRKRIKIKKTTVRKLIFQDQTLWIFEIDRVFKIYTDAEELEKVLVAKGASLKTYETHQTFNKDFNTWQFQPSLFLEIERGSSQNISFWIIRIENHGNKFYDYRNTFPFKEIKALEKHYEGNELPEVKDYPEGQVPQKPVNSNIGCLIAFAIIALAALIYAGIY